jgi:hypothetical protein
LVNEITNKKLSDLKTQTENILDTLIEAEMNTVFTNDSKYLSARDELLAVIFLTYRKQLPLKMIHKNFSLKKSKND